TPALALRARALNHRSDETTEPPPKARAPSCSHEGGGGGNRTRGWKSENDVLKPYSTPKTGTERPLLPRGSRTPAGIERGNDFRRHARHRRRRRPTRAHAPRKRTRPHPRPVHLPRQSVTALLPATPH